MDYQTLFTRPFQFVREKLGPVDVAIIYFDGEVEKIDLSEAERIIGCARYISRDVRLVSNKGLSGYENRNGVYVKTPSQEIIDRNQYPLSKRLAIGNCYENGCESNPNTADVSLNDNVFGTREYVFILSKRVSEILESVLATFPEDIVVVHELAHAYNHKSFGNRLNPVVDEKFAILFELFYLLEEHPDYLEARLEHLDQIARREGNYVHIPASQEALRIWKTNRSDALVIPTV